jgi:flagellar biosynthesis/type III secretory pathway chaperone
MSTSREVPRISVTDLRAAISTLAREVDLLWRLCSVLEAEQRALVIGDVEHLREHVEAQIALIKEVAALEDERRRLVGDPLPRADSAGPVKLSELAEGAPDDEAASLDGVRAALREVLAALGKVNANNSMLIKQSLSYIDRALTMAAGEDTASSVYTPNGDVKCPTGQIALNRTV